MVLCSNIEPSADGSNISTTNTNSFEIANHSAVFGTFSISTSNIYGTSKQLSDDTTLFDSIPPPTNALQRQIALPSIKNVSTNSDANKSIATGSNINKPNHKISNMSLRYNTDNTSSINSSQYKSVHIKSQFGQKLIQGGRLSRCSFKKTFPVFQRSKNVHYLHVGDWVIANQIVGRIVQLTRKIGTSYISVDSVDQTRLKLILLFFCCSLHHCK